MPSSSTTAATAPGDHQALSKALAGTKTGVATIADFRRRFCVEAPMICRLHVTFRKRKKLKADKTRARHLGDKNLDPINTRSVAQALQHSGSLSIKTSEMASECPNDNELDKPQRITNVLFQQSLRNRRHQSINPLQQYTTAKAFHLQRMRRTLPYVPDRRTRADSDMVVTLHNCALQHFSLILELALIS